jgi:uncharacterized protein
MTADLEDIGSNGSDNPSIHDVVQAGLSRRTVLGGGAAAALAFLGGSTLLAGAASATDQPVRPGAVGTGKRRSPLVGFTSVPVSDADALVVPHGYVAEVLIPWGTPLLTSGPAWKKDASNTAAEQAQQVGMHHDGMHFFPLGRGPEANRRGLLCLNHEYIDPVGLYTDGYPPSSVDFPKEKVDKALAAHGVTVIEIALVNGRWTQVDSTYNRRITGTTPMAFSGPVGLDHPWLQSNNAPIGTLNNCAHGYTPWGTYLTCEENWNGYFGTKSAGWTPSELDRRYGVSKDGFGYRWHEGDPRFDLAVNHNEIFRFGWVVEIDPFDPASTPVKRTALGRIKHEGATCVESRGRAVVYSGDDENRDYVYKFVSARPWRQMRTRGVSPLDEGTLYVAQFHDDGTGSWVPLVHGQGPLTVANGWADQADVLLRTRQAADALGATKMDRPEWITVDARTGNVYATMTNGSGSGGAVNPRDPNPYGHILRWKEDGGDATGTRFAWEIFVLAGDPKWDSKVDINGDIFASPDGIWIDHDGRLWIQTDISNSSQNRPASRHEGFGNNAMLCADPTTGEVRRFLVGPRGAEITGVHTTPDGETMFCNVQHPGEVTRHWTETLGQAPSAANPRAVSNWPDHDPAGRPRSATVVIRKIGGGKIGT